MSNRNKKGRLFIVSAPSGAGKTTLCNHALKQLPNLIRSVSYTTRQKRKNEKQDVDYHFITETGFKKMMAEDRFAEWAVVHGHYYGTDRQCIEAAVGSGKDVILSIDVQGGKQLIKLYPDAVTIFIHTPSFEELKKRLFQRKSDTTLTIEKRLQGADMELKASKLYQHHIVNDRFKKALKEFIALIRSKRRR